MNRLYLVIRDYYTVHDCAKWRDSVAVHQNENRRLAKFENWQFVGRDRGFQLKAAFNRSVVLSIRRRGPHV